MPANTLNLRTITAALPVIMLFALPLVGALLAVLAEGLNIAGWQALWQHPQLLPALILSFWIGCAATLASLCLSLLIAANTQLNSKATALGAMLALPHLAFAIGLGFLVMPSGLLARGVSFLITGWTSPPLWTTTHDTYGIALIIALTCKETCFLVFALNSILSRPEIVRSFTLQKSAAQALGHGALSIWARLFIPQLLAQMIWPLIIVFVYATTVVDMALVLGPTQPPTFADLMWRDINAADPMDNARGAAGALLISLMIAVFFILLFLIGKLLSPAFRNWLAMGPNVFRLPNFGVAAWRVLQALFLIVVATLVLLSFAQLWPFPDLWPNTFSPAPWQRALLTPQALTNSIALGLVTSIVSLAIVIVWFECVPEYADRQLTLLSILCLGLPAILLGLGQYRLFLRLGLSASASGLFLAHLAPVVAYMFIFLQGPYRNFDPRWKDVASGILASPLSFLLRVKWPMLSAPILASVAVGFAVSIAQYVPAQLISAGRFSTLPIEAVTLSSGSNRSLTAAFALLLMTPPLVAFVICGWLGRPRWRNA